MKLYNQSDKSGTTRKIDWKKVSLDKLKSSLDADTEPVLNDLQTNTSKQ